MCKNVPYDRWRNYCSCAHSSVRLTVKRRLSDNVIIIVCVLVLYSVNRFILKWVVDVPIISYLLKCHFNDWLGGIFIIAYINIVLEHSRYKHMQIHTLRWAIIINVLCGVFWEFVGPCMFRYGTSDCYDILAYIVGGITYIMIQRALTKGKRVV